MANKTRKRSRIEQIERGAHKATQWIGSTKSLVVHTIVFVLAFALPLFGARFDMVLLVLTTFLSLEAIYLAIFIQMTVNKNTADIEDIQEDIEDIQENVDEIQEDIEDIEEDSNEDQKIEQKEAQAINAIQTILTQLQKEIEQLKKK